MITYDLWWGDSYLCLNFRDFSELLHEIKPRLDGTLEFHHPVMWFYQNTNDIADAIDTRHANSGVMLIGITPRFVLNGYVVPPRAYQIMWREIGDRE